MHNAMCQLGIPWIKSAELSSCIVAHISLNPREFGTTSCYKAAACMGLPALVWSSCMLFVLYIIISVQYLATISSLPHTIYPQPARADESVILHKEASRCCIIHVLPS